MSGHSKWSKIKRGKEVKDKQRGTLFSKLSRLITLAVAEGGGITDPEHNVKLRLAIDKAKQNNLPKVNIDRAIERGISPDKGNLKEIIYEVFAPGGTSVIVLATSDNPKRTLSELRSVVDSNGGKIGNQGSVMHLFKKCGLAVFNSSKVDEGEILNFAEKVEAFDIDSDSSSYYVYFPYEYLGKLKNLPSGIEPQVVDIDFKPLTTIKIEDMERLKKINEFVEALENLEDVQKVYANFTSR